MSFLYVILCLFFLALALYQGFKRHNAELKVKELSEDLTAVQNAWLARGQTIAQLSFGEFDLQRQIADLKYRVDRLTMNGNASAHLADYRIQQIIKLEDERDELLERCAEMVGWYGTHEALDEEGIAYAIRQLKRNKPL